MTQYEREELVDRYLAGSMRQHEESEFFLHVAVDDELQRMLKAYRIMDVVIQKDRELVVEERSSYREHILGLLAITPAAVGGGATVVGGAASSSSGAAGVAGLGVWKTLLLTVTGISLTVGTVVVSLDQPKEPVRVPAVATPSAVDQKTPSVPSETVMPGETITAPNDGAQVSTGGETQPREIPAGSSKASSERGSRSGANAKSSANNGASSATVDQGASEKSLGRKDRLMKLPPQQSSKDGTMSIDPKKEKDTRGK